MKLVTRATFAASKYNEMKEICGFKVIALHTKPSPSIFHTLFAKMHSLRKEDPDKPNKRTLFVINVPPYVMEEHLQYGFGKVGEVTNVICQEKVGPAEDSVKFFDKFLAKTPLKGFKVAFVVFKSTKSLEKALKLDKLCLYDEESGASVLRTGIEAWGQDYINAISVEDALQAEIDDYMAKHDEEERTAQLADKAGTVDDEGWITVTKRGPVAGFEQKESVINRLEEKIEKGRKKKELTNFYTFQIRQSKMKHIVNLRKKFEEDKSKIERLKQSRRFNPFNK